MKDEDKTREQPLNEIAEPRQRIAELEASASRRNEAEEILRKRTRDLGERVKELNCLYGISKLLEKPSISLGQILQGVVDLIPPAWQYPEITCARVSLHDQIFTTKNFKETILNQTSDIASCGERIGALQVYYLEERSERDEGPFLKEERSLLNAIGESLGRVFERKQAEEEKKKLEAQLQYAQRMEALGTLAGGIAHNFNNLLAGIMGNISLTLFDSDPTQPHFEHLKRIEKLVKSGSQLTSQLLGYARGGRYDVRPLDLNQLVKETSNTFGATKKEIRIHRELAEDLLGIKADQGQIEQVLLNVFVNAADAMSGGGDLFVETMNVTDKDMSGRPYKPEPGAYVLLTVRDTGMGMDEKTLERIFEPFFTTKGLGTGTGLGLASVYGIIKAHQGYIDVESEKGQGTTFEIYLPASESKGGQACKSAEHAAKGSETILLVDDEVMVLGVGVEVLRELGYTVLEAQGGGQAVELYNEKRDAIDLVILDMIMPDMGGGETYDMMREINPEVKVLLSSGYSIDGEATEILERGCDGFIQKPFSVEELSMKIREVLDRK